MLTSNFSTDDKAARSLILEKEDAEAMMSPRCPEMLQIRWTFPHLVTSERGRLRMGKVHTCMQRFRL
jgi:hypothetical protein